MRGFIVSRQSSDAAAHIVALASFARSQAAVEGRAYRLNIDTDTGEFWLTVQTSGGFEIPSNQQGRVFNLPDGVTAEWETGIGKSRWVTFYPDGRSQATSIRFEDRRGRVVRVVCMAPAEQFRIVSGDGSIL